MRNEFSYRTTDLLFSSHLSPHSLFCKAVYVYSLITEWLADISWYNWLGTFQATSNQGAPTSAFSAVSEIIQIVFWTNDLLVCFILGLLGHIALRLLSMKFGVISIDGQKMSPEIAFPSSNLWIIWTCTNDPHRLYLFIMCSWKKRARVSKHKNLCVLMRSRWFFPFKAWLCNHMLFCCCL